MTSSQKIVPFLWFDQEAEDAANFYVSAFMEGEIGEITRYSEANAAVAGRKAGAVMTVDFEIAGQPFVALNGGPLFTITPAISFFVNCTDAAEVDGLYEKLVEGGTVLMPLQAYPFSERYAWVEDKFGISWQLFVGPPRTQKIAPCLMFVGDQAGRAEEAMTLYTTLFPQAAIENIARYGAEHAPNTEGTVMHGVFSLAGQEFRAMDSALEHDFTFTEAVSLQVLCDTQDEIDHYWAALADGGDPDAQQCGWLKDRFGVSWQVVPRALFAMLQDPDAARVERVTQAFLQMKKFDIAALDAAFHGESPGILHR